MEYRRGDASSVRMGRALGGELSSPAERSERITRSFGLDFASEDAPLLFDSFSDCFPASNESSTGGWVASSARSKHLSANDTNAHVLPVIHHSSPAPTIITDPGRREPKPDDMTGLATYRNSIIPKVLSGVRGSSMSPMEPFKPSVNGATKCPGALPEYKWRWLRCAAERRKSSPKPWSPPASPSIRSSN